MPCAARAAMSHWGDGATPQTIEATVNQISPMRKTRRRPKRSPSAPPNKRNAESVRV